MNFIVHHYLEKKGYLLEALYNQFTTSKQLYHKLDLSYNYEEDGIFFTLRVIPELYERKIFFCNEELRLTLKATKMIE